jgi:hypothetical protein
MTVLIVVAGLVLGMFTYEPMWFDTRPHYYSDTYENNGQCDLARELLIEIDSGDKVEEPKGTVCTDKHALYITK